MRPPAYRFWRDWLWCSVLWIYLVNRWLIEPLTVGRVGFFHSYVNDLICLPFWLPPTIWLYDILRLRRAGGPPRLEEVLLHWAIWSMAFEFVAPAMGGVFGYPVYDPWDIACYGVGGLAGWLWWRRNVESAGDAATPAG